MGVEEPLGHPFPGDPAERIETLKKRIAYLQTTGQEAEGEILASINHDLAEAHQQFVEWKPNARDGTSSCRFPAEQAVSHIKQNRHSKPIFFRFR
jgi:hypothetical protein